jgi:hypothetical protein
VLVPCNYIDISRTAEIMHLAQLFAAAAAAAGGGGRGECKIRQPSGFQEYPMLQIVDSIEQFDEDAKT